MTTHPAHRRIEQANAITAMRILSPAEQIEALASLLAYPQPSRRPTPRHPETDCPCAPCVDRNMRLEQRAEERAAERRGDYMSEREARRWGL